MTSTSPTLPDISSLSISSQQQHRPHDSPYDFDALQAGQNQRQQFHFSTSPAVPGQMPYTPLGLGQSPLKSKPPIRAGLPAQWIDSQILNDSRSMSPPSNSDISSGGSPPLHQMPVPMQTQPPAQAQPVSNPEDEIIPTAIVIKNIPFNVKKETLLDIIASLSIPTPYAFNYHLDAQGAFRGLAFANFRQASDADAVVAALNGFDVQGRKLRVEYKKVLQQGEKERIEREKALRRMRSMQLEKEQHALQQHQPSLDDFGSLGGAMYGTPRSVSTPYANPYQQQDGSPSMPMPVPQQYGVGVGSPIAPPPSTTPSTRGSSTELDLNDPATLEIYSRILLFKDDPMRDELAFSRTLSPKQRRIVHLVAQKLGVYHYSVGEGEERYAVVTRIDPERVNHPMQAEPRRTLSRAPSTYNMSAPQMSASSLRAKKSMPDMKTLHNQAPRLTSRASNGNIREYATIASPSRRSPGGFGSLFGNSAFSGSGVPPVPSLPSTLSTPLNLNGNGTIREGEVASNVVRQPRGPSAGSGFATRRERVSASESATHGLEARSHEPLEL
ncbi:PIN4 [Sanghuangporus vaninii]